MEILKIQDLVGLEEGTQNDPFYALTTKSAMEAVSFLKEYYIGILQQRGSVKFKVLNDGLLVQLKDSLRRIDIKDPMDQIIHPKMINLLYCLNTLKFNS